MSDGVSETAEVRVDHYLIDSGSAPLRAALDFNAPPSDVIKLRIDGLAG
jgi:hypothetical protein